MSGRAWSGLHRLPALGGLTLQPSSWAPGGCTGEKSHGGKPQGFLAPSASARAPVLVLAVKQGSHCTQRCLPHHSDNERSSRADFHQHLRQRGLAFTMPSTSVSLSSHVFKKNPSTSHNFPLAVTSSIKKAGKQQSLSHTILGKMTFHGPLSTSSNSETPI